MSGGEAMTPSTEAGRNLLVDRERYELWHPIDGRREMARLAILAIEAEARADALAGLECPAALHHRVRSVRAGSMVIGWAGGVGEEHLVVEPDVLESDRCTACGHEYPAAPTTPGEEAVDDIAERSEDLTDRPTGNP